MKLNIIVIAACLLMIIGCSSKEDGLSTDLVNNPNSLQTKADGSPPIMSWEELKHDFGTLTQGEEVSWDFKFKNTGGSDLIISDASASCGCTVPSFPREPIKPGESGVIPVKFNSVGKTDVVQKTVTIKANTNPSDNQITIKATIQAP